MNSLLAKVTAPFIFGVLTLSAVSANAEYDTLFIDAAQGDEMTHLRLGIGETPAGEEGEKVTSMFYLSYFNSEDNIKQGSNSLGEGETEILSIGAGGFGYLTNPNENGGAEFDFELSRTEIEGDNIDYKRTGIGFRTQLFVPVAAGLQANIGFNLRPYFLSPDWDDDSKLEFEYQGGLEYAFNWDVAVYAHYRYVALINSDDKEVKLAEGTVFGLRARF